MNYGENCLISKTMLIGQKAIPEAKDWKFDYVLYDDYTERICLSGFTLYGTAGNTDILYTDDKWYF